MASGRAAQKAQRRALSGVSDSGLRAAAGARRRLVEDLTDRAIDALAAAGAAPASHVEDIAATFEAATVDPNAAEVVGEGRLSAPVHVAADFSGATALLAMSRQPDAGDGDEVDAALAERRRAAIRVLEAARRRSDESARMAAARESEATSLADRSAEARQALVAARDAAAAADEAAQEARDVADAARDRADADAAAMWQARDALAHLQ